MASLLAAIWVVTVLAISLFLPEHRSAQFSFFPWSYLSAQGPLWGSAAGEALASSGLAVMQTGTYFFAARGCSGIFESLFRYRGADREERFATSLVLGALVVSFMFLGFGLSGLFRTPVLAVVIVASAGVGLCRRVAPMERLAWFQWRGGASFALVLATAFLFIQMFPYVFSPETERDALACHLLIPERALALGRIVCLPFDALYDQLPLPFELLYAWPSLSRSEIGAKLIHLLYLLSLLGFIQSFARRTSGAVPGAAIVLCLASCMVLVIGTRAKNDLYAEAGMVGGILMLLGRRSPARILTSGFLIGAAVAAKYTSIMGAGIWLVLAAFPGRRTSGVNARGPLAAGLFLLAAPVIPWMARAWLMLDDPVFPFLSPRVFHGLQWSNGAREVLTMYLTMWRFDPFGNSWARLLPTAAYQLLLDTPAVLVLLPVWLCARGLPARFWLASGVVWTAYLLLLQVAHVPRYTLPMIHLLLAVGLWGADGLPAVARRILVAGALGIGCLTRMYLVPLALGVDHRALFGPAWSCAFGGVSQDTYRAARLGPMADARTAVRAWIQPRQRVLLIDEDRAYGLGRMSVPASNPAQIPTIWQMARESWSAHDLSRRLRQWGVEGMLVNTSLTLRVLSEQHPFDWRPRELRLYRDFARHQLRRVWAADREDGDNGSLDLYVVTKPGGNQWPGFLPDLPGTAPMYARTQFRLAALASSPAARAELDKIEKDRIRMQALLPDIGTSAKCLGNFYFATGRPREAQHFLSRAANCGAGECATLVRLSVVMAKSDPGGAARMMDQARRRCGGLADEMRQTEAARWPY